MMMESFIYLLMMFGMLTFFSLGLWMYLFTFLLFLMNLDILGMGFCLLSDYFSLDYLSFYLILLSFWFISIIFMFENSMIIRCLMLCFLSFVLFMFSVVSFLGFYLFFEASIIPIFILIMLYGGNKERYMAGLFMLVYTLLSSLMALFALMYESSVLFSFDMIYGVYSVNYLEGWVGGLFMFMFLVKVPMFLVHIWLPKAHVESPVCGSMLLAGLMLKMGGYGIIRFKSFCSINTNLEDFYFSVSLVGGIFISLISFYQSDLKVMVAYSSIIHMCTMLCSLFSGVDIGFMGGMLMMLGHGICSSCLFFMVNDMYMSSGSRLIYFNKGLMIFSPVYSFLWLLILLNNLGIPPCFSFISELTILVSIFNYNMVIFFLSLLLIFCSSWFMLVMMYLWVCVGGYKSFMLLGSGSILLKSYLIVFIHLIPLNLLIFFLVDMF